MTFFLLAEYSSVPFLYSVGRKGVLPSRGLSYLCICPHSPEMEGEKQRSSWRTFLSAPFLSLLLINAPICLWFFPHYFLIAPIDKSLKRRRPFWVLRSLYIYFLRCFESILTQTPPGACTVHACLFILLLGPDIELLTTHPLVTPFVDVIEDDTSPPLPFPEKFSFEPLKAPQVPFALSAIR